MIAEIHRHILFLTHAEVDVDPRVPIADWPLSDRGRERHRQFCGDAALAGATAIYASAERKAVEAASIHGAALGIAPATVVALYENDRTATGYLPPADFERTADAFFARPDDSIGGWETARTAQGRIVDAVRRIAGADATDGDILIVAHGAVGALLRCHLRGVEIDRSEDQPAGGGHLFGFTHPAPHALADWRAI